MIFTKRQYRGFTLIEMMVTVVVFVILVMLAVPSFTSFRQRSALRGAAEQTVSFWNQARFEAAKRNQMVKVGVSTSGADFCLGAATTTNPADTTPCDCLTASACDVATFPATTAASQSEWRGVTFVSITGTTPTLGGLNNKVAVIEPKRTSLATSTQAGAITLAGPSGSKSYQVNISIDKFGRAAVCESTTAVDKIIEYANRRCAP